MLRWWCCSVGWASSSFLRLPLSDPSTSLSSLEGEPHPACPLVSSASNHLVPSCKLERGFSSSGHNLVRCVK